MLARRWTLAWSSLLALFSFGQGEAYADAQPCTPSRLKEFWGFIPQCCEDGVDNYLRLSDDEGGTLVLRTYAPDGLKCRNEDLTTGCGIDGDGDCFYGPNGSTPPEFYGEFAVVFHSMSEPTQCGRDSNGAEPDGDLEEPEPYVNQKPWSGLTGTAPNYTTCRKDGTPGNMLTLRVECSGPRAKGRIMWRNLSVMCEGDGDQVERSFWIPLKHPGQVTHSSRGWDGWGADCENSQICRLFPEGDMAVIGFFSGP